MNKKKKKLNELNLNFNKDNEMKKIKAKCLYRIQIQYIRLTDLDFFKNIIHHYKIM